MERNHGTYQDRLVKELRLAEINTIAAGNQFLQASYCVQISLCFRPYYGNATHDLLRSRHK